MPYYSSVMVEARLNLSATLWSQPLWRDRQARIPFVGGKITRWMIGQLDERTFWEVEPVDIPFLPFRLS